MNKTSEVDALINKLEKDMDLMICNPTKISVDTLRTYARSVLFFTKMKIECIIKGEEIECN